MKKLLVLILVFVMSPAANAALQISVDGLLDPADSEIWLLPSETITLGIWSDIPITNGGEGVGYWVMYVGQTMGTLSGGIAMPPSSPDWIIIGPAPLAPPIPPVISGLSGAIDVFRNELPAGMIYDMIVFHSENIGDATIVLQEITDMWVLGDVYDTVTIHIPEPMTFLLLGLGGLALLRKRKP